MMSSIEEMEQMLHTASFGNSFGSLQSRMDEFNSALKSEMEIRISNMNSLAKNASDSLISLAKSNAFDASRLHSTSNNFMYNPTTIISSQIPSIELLLAKSSLPPKQNTVTRPLESHIKLEEDEEQEENDDSEVIRENERLKKENAKLKHLHSEVLHIVDILFSHKDEILNLKADIYEFKKFEPILRLIKEKFDKAAREDNE